MEPNSLCSARLYNKGNGHKLLLGRFILDVRKTLSHQEASAVLEQFIQKGRRFSVSGGFQAD